ncbi:unnamed protein product [Prorocentrum cordatum]|uniref:Uncharacterized protein n=1 Tax=Prorocentrum cordatum TaxID=2364126 RepID=A0ABN9XBA8_9DINO|nr:unnamed protein product [Polarella glacialis]
MEEEEKEEEEEEGGELAGACLPPHLRGGRRTPALGSAPGRRPARGRAAGGHASSASLSSRTPSHLSGAASRPPMKLRRASLGPPSPRASRGCASGSAALSPTRLGLVLVAHVEDLRELLACTETASSRCRDPWDL